MSDASTGENIRIRNFIYPQDYPTVYALWQQAGEGIHLRRSDEPDEIAKKIQRDSDLFLLAEAVSSTGSEGQVVGTVLGGFDGRRGMVYHLAVALEYRQRGVGTTLMAELEARLRAKGCIRCYLLVTKDNDDAIRFYEGHDWQRMDLYAYGKNLL